MDYSQYTTSDFVKNEYFQKWVINPDQENDHFWQAWIKKHPEKKSVIEDAINIIKDLQLSGNYTANQDFIRVWQKIKVTANKKQLAKQNSGNQFNFLKYAAILLMLMATTYVIYNLSSESKAVYRAEYEQKEIELSDGSKLTLNEGANLKFKTDKNNNRHAWIEGEAFFKIKHIANSRFIVHTEMADVVVVGTSFNVNTNGDKVQVVLNEGKVLVNQKGQQLEMNPGEFLEIDQHAKVKTKNVNTELYTSWRAAIINFDQIPLQQIASWIEDRYSRTVFIENDQLTQITFSGTIPTKNLEVILQAIEISYDVEIQTIEDKIFIDEIP